MSSSTPVNPKKVRFLSELARPAPTPTPGSTPPEATHLLDRAQTALNDLRAAVMVPGRLVEALAEGWANIAEAERLAFLFPQHAALLRCQALIIATNMGRRMHDFGKRFDIARRCGVVYVFTLLNSEYSKGNAARVRDILAAPRPADNAAEALWPAMFNLPDAVVRTCVALFELHGVLGAQNPMLDILNCGQVGTSFARLCDIVR